MAGEFVEQILNEMSAKKDARLAAAAGRARTVRDACPELKAVELEIARAARAGKETLPELMARREALVGRWLAEQGLPQEWLLAQPDCPLCSDNGFSGGQLCTCVRNEVSRRMYRDAGLTQNSPSFEKYDLSLFPDTVMTKSGATVRDYMAFLREMGQTYAARFPGLQKPNLLFTGPTGCGKTYLLDCIAAELIKRGFWVVRATAFGANEIMAKAVFEKANPDHLFDCDLLALDDLGSEPLFSKTKTYLFNLLNERMAAGRPYIVSTNLSAGEILQRYEERIFSRITDQRTTRIFEFEGVDLRQCGC